MSLRVITYDIADNKRRRRVAAILEARAARVQDSVFEARLTTAAATALLAEINRETGRGDSVRIYAVPDSALTRCREIGGPEIAGGGRYWLA